MSWSNEPSLNLERARRRARSEWSDRAHSPEGLRADAPGGHAEANAIELLRRGHTAEACATESGLPLSTVVGVESFYDLLPKAPGGRVCTGTACRFPGGVPSRRLGPRELHRDEVHCLGRCYAAPADLATELPGIPQRAIPRRTMAADPVVLRNLLGGGSSEEEIASPLAEYPVGLEGDEILSLLDESGLRGRGGAAFPTGAKWRAARDAPGEQKFVVANGDEGDPGSYVDRLLLEEDPHAILAGMVACATVTGANQGIVYVRGEYPDAAEAVGSAIEEARAAGALGNGFDVEVHVGAGSYVCGEESALLRAIEGLRAEPTPRPPYPATCGLHGKPTVVQNVETLAVIPWLLRHRRNPGRKAICLSGAVRRPGVVEIELGTPLRTVLEEGGGGCPEGRVWKMALIGGPMGHVVPASAFDAGLGSDSLQSIGHGGTVVLDRTVTARQLAEHLFAFARSESCGSCTPCRVGTAQLHRLEDRAALERLLDVLEMGSLCGFGKGVSRPIRDLLRHFGDEVFAT